MLYYMNMNTNEGINWFRCKKCNKPLLKLTDKSVVINEIYCRHCKTSFQVEIRQGNIIKNDEIK